MNCPSCYHERRTSVVKTVAAPGATMRLRQCDCGAQFWTVERLFKLGQATHGQPPPNHGQPTGNHPQLAGNRPATFGGTIGGSESPVLDLVPISSGTLEAKSTEVVSKRRRGRGDAAEYPAEFEQLWSQCTGRRGNKHPAFKAWQRERPPLNLTVERYLLWSKTDNWQRGFVPHFATWLNRRGWQDEPSPAEMAGPPQAQTSLGGPPRKSWQEEQSDRAIAEAMALTSGGRTR